GANLGPPPVPTAPQPLYDSTRRDFGNFLDNMPFECQTALFQWLQQLHDQILNITFYDLSYEFVPGNPQSQLGFEPAGPYVGVGHVPRAFWFAQRHGGNIFNTATAVFAAPATAFGIYYDGSTTQFTGDNMYLLLHEMMHIVTNQGDDDLARTLHVNVGQGQ